MIAYHDEDSGLHWRATVRAMKIRDGLAVEKDRQVIADKYDSDPATMLKLFNLPLLAHSSRLEKSTDGQTWEVVVLDEDTFFDLTETFVLEWLNLVMTINPQHGFSQVEFLKKKVGELLPNSSS